MVTPYQISSGDQRGDEADNAAPLMGGYDAPSTDNWVFGVRKNTPLGLWSRVVDAWDRFSSSWGMDDWSSDGSRSFVEGSASARRARIEAVVQGERVRKRKKNRKRAPRNEQMYAQVSPPWANAKPAPTLELKELRSFLLDALNDELRQLSDPSNRLLVENLLGSVNRDLSFPPFPDAAKQLDTILRQGDPSMSRVVELVERDPSLVGSVWARAHGSAYLMPPSSLSLAIARIGFDSLWRLGMEICMYSGVFRVRGYQQLADEIRMHGVVTAEVASWMNNGQGGPVYLAGLLHDVGKLVLLRSVSPKKSDGLPTREFVDHLFRAYHSSFGVLLARTWNLGDAVAGMVGFHHAPHEAPESIRRLTEILSVADVVTHTADHYRRGQDCGGMLALLELERPDFNPARAVSMAQAIFARIDAEERESLGCSQVIGSA